MISGPMSGPGDLSDVIVDGRDGAIVRIRVKPRARRPGVLGLIAGEISIGVRAAPEAGRATDEALRSLARWLGLPRARLELSSGAKSRSKRVLIRGSRAEELRDRAAARLGAE
jgi:hypothetical protein